MKKFSITRFLLLFVVVAAQAQRTAPNLIISEICMGVDPRYSYAEISNIGSDTADLSEVYISVLTNAGADFHRSSQVNTTWRLDDPRFRKRLPGNKLAPGQTALIVNNLVTENDIGVLVQLVPPFYWAHADIITLEVMELNGTSPLRFFGGDDAFFLVWDKNGDGEFNWEVGVDQILDLVGNSADYGGVREVYDIAGVTDATLDNVIIRKAEAESGNAADFTSTRGTGPEDSEWIVMPWDPKTSSLFLPSAGHHISFRELQNYQPDTIRYGDIMMRSLRVHPKDIMDPHNTLTTAKEFHVDKIMWVYENNARYNEEVRNEGILIGTTMSHNAFEKWYSNSTIEERNEFVDKYTIVDLNGAQVLPAHMESFSDGFVRHFEPDQSDPEWLEYYTEYVYYLYHLGIDGLHRDDPAINSGAPRIGGTFTAPAIEYFRNYLQQKYSAQELANLGVDNIESFNVRDHFLDLGAPVGDTFWRWRGSPLMPVYLEAMRQADREFFLQVKRVVENRTGIKIPWSLNGSGPIRPHEEAFDYRIGEFQFHHNQPQTMMIMSEYVRKAGIKQAYVGIVDRNYETKPGHVAATRKHIATAYATGTIPLVPWDMYMHDAPRYFGTYSEYGDLYKFVSENRNVLDEYEAVSAGGIDFQAGLYSWLPNMELVQPEGNPEARIWVKDFNVFAFLRSKASGESSVVHIVDWNEEAAPVHLSFSPAEITGTPAAKLTFLRHDEEPYVIEDYAGGDIVLPPVDIWGILVVEPKAASGGTIPAPKIIAPLRSVVPEGSVVSFVNPGENHVVEARFVPYNSAGDNEFSEAQSDFFPVIGKSGILEAFVRDVQTDITSDTIHVAFLGYQDHTTSDPNVTDTLQSIRLEDRFTLSAGEMKVNGSFLADEMVLMGQKYERGISTIDNAVLSASLEPDWRYFKVSVGLDDYEDRRPSVRLQVLFDGEVAYETPIINPMKSEIADEDRRVFHISLRIPEGSEEIVLKALHGGFFKDQNTVIWAEPTAYVVEEEINSVEERHSGPVIYPSPASEYVKIVSPGNPLGNISLIDNFGRLLFQKEVQNSIYELNLSHITPGIYFIRLEGANDTEVKRIIKL